jgi:DNA-binding beta-propeller fold protein YncE
MNPIPAPSELTPRSRGARSSIPIAALVILFACVLSCIAPAAAVDLPPGDVTPGEQYTFIREWSWSLSCIRGITVTPAGEVYVADSANRRIHRISSTGTILSDFGYPIYPQFNQPYGVAFDADGNVYVADFGNGRVLKFGPTGALLAQFGSAAPGTGQLSRPRGVAVDGAGDVFVSDFALQRVVEFAPDGSVLRAWGKPDGTPGITPAEFAQPYGLALDGAGALYVADTNYHRVQKFAPTGELLGIITNPSGAVDGRFNSPVGIVVDPDGNVYVVESVGNRVQKFSPSGAFLAMWGTAGTGPGQFENPQGVAIDTAGRVYISQSGSVTGKGRAQVFLGPPVARFTPVPHSGPAPLTVRFTDASTGLPTSWAWDLGDGETADVPAPVHTFETPGT